MGSWGIIIRKGNLGPGSSTIRDPCTQTSSRVTLNTLASLWKVVVGISPKFLGSYPGTDLKPQDVWNISCLGGWTAGDYVGTVSDLARFTYDLYSTHSPKIVGRGMQAHLTDFGPAGPGHFKFYGMGTFSLDWSIGPFGGKQEAYGHVGDTYGYQSQTTYFPADDFALTVGTNVETFSQAQPA